MLAPGGKRRVIRDRRGEHVEIDGTVERVTYSNPESGWSVARVHVPTEGEVTAVGNLLGVQPGEHLRLRGSWESHKKFGRQFRVESSVSSVPATSEGIEKYLGSGLVKGIGKVMAQRLVEHFGDETLDVIEGAPGRLAEVPGIGPKRSIEIQRSWCRQRDIKEVMLFLKSHDVSTGFALKIYRRYGPGAIGALRSDPFRLAREIHGIGFRSADAIAKSLGVAVDAPRRVEAGLLHTLGEHGRAGHVFASRERLIDDACKLLGAPRAGVEEVLAALEGRGEVVVEDRGDGREVFAARHHHAEQLGATRLAHIIRAPIPAVSIDVERAVVWAEQTQGWQFSARQRDAVRAAITEKVLVLTGGPGTGKTSIVNAMASILEKKGLRILLAAPTGRAARRLQEGSGRPAQTIHRLLEMNPIEGRFLRDRSNPLEVDLVVVDEMSMVDTMLFHHLVDAIPPAARVILVGDADQLPSVGAGNVLGDLIASASVPVVRLTEIFRQARHSSIVVNAHRVNAGELPTASAGEGDDFFFIEKSEVPDIVDTVKELVGRRIPGRYGIEAGEGIQVITPMQKGPLGVVNLNAELQALVNPKGDTLVRGSRLLRVDDRVMQNRNNYDLGVFNGDIGRVVEVDVGNRRLVARFDDREVAYDETDLDELTLAYAITIHKSQGSEYPVIIVPVHTTHYVMLRRNLLYTAITRGKRLVVLVGTHRAAAIAVDNRGIEERCTRFGERLREAVERRAPSGSNGVDQDDELA